MTHSGRSAKGERSTQLAQLGAGAVEFRLERRGPVTVVLFHGGHMRAGLSLGEEVYAEADCSVLVPSRPGYGRTPVSTGRSAVGFADVTASLREHLGITDVAAVVGVSGGGPTAVAMAARHPALGRRLILQSAVGPLPWPDRRTHTAAQVVFAPRTEPVSWALVRTLLRRMPDAGLRMLLRDLTLLTAPSTVAALRPGDRAKLIALLSRMRSGHGFLNDLRELKATEELTRLMAGVAQPSLVIASRHDGAVPFAHAQALAAGLRRAELVESLADSHFIWFGRDWTTISERIHAFLLADPAS
ncbi:alpha/beta fold hydrolase [Streptomyces sp. NPDC093591]|uniref:alpha/beta fold hydrolase n=1 Tax=Streptomyces sp. NPDC093591 TaxID=3366044 RepID=UPI003811B89B